MLLRPQVKDFKIIGFYLGKLIIGFCPVYDFPHPLSLGMNEWAPLFDFDQLFSV